MMTFTSDEERREIAENLRREILYTRGSLGDWWMRLHEAVTGSEDFPVSPKRPWLQSPT